MIYARHPVSLSLCAAVLLAVSTFWLAAPRHALAISGDDLALDYLIQKVCVDPAGRVLLVDPYICPAGDRLRSLEPGEALPYHRYDQPLSSDANDLQRRDAYPVRTADGREIVIVTFDHAPFEQFKPAVDGYSIYVARDGWASSAGTRDGRDGGTTFFGVGCKPYGGWVFFPVPALSGNLIEPGEARVPIRGVNWERNGESWPGSCPSRYRTNSLTSWGPMPAFQFGGTGGTPIKTIDAIRSIHGFVDRPQFLAQGHLEVFYFTRLYGATRWESWAPEQRYESDPGLRQRAEMASERCDGLVEDIYRGVRFVRIACRDWTHVVVPLQPEAPPPWPVPALN